MISPIALAEEPRYEATLENYRVSIGNPLYLYVAFYGGQGVERPQTPVINGLKVRYVGPSSKMSVINGEVTRSITHTYLVIPLKGGQYNIGPFFTKYNGKVFKADAVTLLVDGSPPRPASSSASSSSPPAGAGYKASRPKGAPYAGDNIFITLGVDKKEVYINEVLPITIKMYAYNTGIKDIEYPTYTHEGFSAGKFEEPEKAWEVHKNVRYDMLVFYQDLFGIKEGRYVLGPAKISCKMVSRKKTQRRASIFGRNVFGDDDFFNGFFGYKAYPVQLESDPVSVTILPFPEKGRPSNFEGAVGKFHMDVQVPSQKVRVGDPIVVRTVITGDGNLDTVTAPVIKVSDEFKTYEPQVSKKNDKKIYEQILIPKTKDAKEVSEVSFSFLDPRNGKYKTISRGPFPVTVTEQPESKTSVRVVSMPGVEQIFYPQEKLGKDIVHIKEDIGKVSGKDTFLFKKGVFWALQIIPLILLMMFYWVNRRKERMRTDKSYARFLKAPRRARKGLNTATAYLKKNEIVSFYDTIFKTLQEYLSGRLDVPKGNVTSQIIEEKLRPSGCDEKMLDMVRDIFSRCEMARYASSVSDGDPAREVLRNTKKVIDYMEKIRL